METKVNTTDFNTAIDYINADVANSTYFTFMEVLN